MLIKCRKCERPVSAKATECPHCGADHPLPFQEWELRRCKECGNKYRSDSEVCGHCGAPRPEPWFWVLMYSWLMICVLWFLGLLAATVVYHSIEGVEFLSWVDDSSGDSDWVLLVMVSGLIPLFFIVCRAISKALDGHSS